jgi:hypothetical protein
MKSAVKGRRFCDATDVIKNAKVELKRLSKMISTTVQSLAEVYTCTREIY